jgi:hypothetical protein
VQAAILHRTSDGWIAIPDSVPGTFTSLSGGFAFSTIDAWAVGTYTPKTPRPLIEHWNGRIWKVFKSPIPKSGGDLSGVSMSSQTEGWAVGTQDLGAGHETALIEAWSGVSWAIDTSLSGPRHSSLSSVCQVPGSNEAWAVGSVNNDVPFVAHYNGSAWGQVATPPVPALATLSSVACVGPDDVWAVGSSNHAPLIEHWDGSAWSTVVPGGNVKFGALQGVAVVPGSSSQLWAVGTKSTGPLFEQYTGSVWNEVGGPKAKHASLASVATAPHGVVEAVGGGGSAFIARRQ